MLLLNRSGKLRCRVKSVKSMLSDLRKMKERNMLFDHYREKFIDIYMNDSAKNMIVSRLLSSRAILYELMA